MNSDQRPFSCSSPKGVVAVLTLFAILPLAVQAHPGHGLHEQGLIHLLTNADHALALAAFACITAIAAHWVRQAIARRALAVAAVSSLSASLVLFLVR